MGKGFLDARLLLFPAHLHAVRSQVVQVTPVLVLVAIDTEVLPVATIGRVIVMVVVFVVYGEFMNILLGKVTATPGTYPGMDF